MKDHLDPGNAGSMAHARRMDRKYGLQRFAYNLTRRYFLMGRDEAIAMLALRDGMHILEIGCGTGRNIAQMLRAAPGLSVDAIDISQEMLKSAATRIGSSRNVRLARADAETFDAEAIFWRSTYDAVLMSYSLSMVPDWRKALCRALASVAPGGRLVIADFGSFAGFGRFKNMAIRQLANHQAPPCPGLAEAVRALADEAGHFSIEHRKCNRGFNQIIVARRGE